MAWYEVVAHFFAGAFLANTVPHFVLGVTGQRFPSVFSRPVGSASSPLANVVWAGINAAIVVLLIALVPIPDPWPLASKIALAAGFFVIAVALALYFGRWREQQSRDAG
jgi:drug/metabolite transporter (DMT)-like permease